MLDAADAKFQKALDDAGIARNGATCAVLLGHFCILAMDLGMMDAWAIRAVMAGMDAARRMDKINPAMVAGTETVQ